jgi:hypothetical protein
LLFAYQSLHACTFVSVHLRSHLPYPAHVLHSENYARVMHREDLPRRLKVWKRLLDLSAVKSVHRPACVVWKRARLWYCVVLWPCLLLCR